MRAGVGCSSYRLRVWNRGFKSARFIRYIISKLTYDILQFWDTFSILFFASWCAYDSTNLAQEAVTASDEMIFSRPQEATLLDRRIPEMTIKVYRVRRLCQDALVGLARLPISTTELAGTSRDHTIFLENGCGTITVRCSFNCSVADLPNLQSVLAYPKRHSLAKFAQALAQLLQGAGKHTKKPGKMRTEICSESSHLANMVLN